MKSLIIFIFCILSFLSFSSFAQERASIKNFYLGQEFKSGECPINTKFSKYIKMYGIKIKGCQLPDKTYAGVPVSHITIGLYNNKIIIISTQFKNEGKNTEFMVAEALVVKYGKPKKVSYNSKEWIIGANGQNDLGDVITLDESGVYLTDNKTLLLLIKEYTKKSASDL